MKRSLSFLRIASFIEGSGILYTERPFWQLVEFSLVRYFIVEQEGKGFDFGIELPRFAAR